MVQEAVARVVPARSLGHDGAAVLQRVQTLPRHRAVAGAARHRHLDLHATALAAIDPERALLRVARALRQDHHVGHQLRGRSGQHLAHQVERPAAVVVLLLHRPVGADDRAAQRAQRRQLQQDARGHDLRHDAAELVGGAAAEQQVRPLAVRRKIAEALAQPVAIHARGVHQAVVAVDAAAQLVAPLRAQRLDGVGVAVHVDDLLVARRHAVAFVLDDPHQVAEGVERHVLGTAHGAASPRSRASGTRRAAPRGC